MCGVGNYLKYEVENPAQINNNLLNITQYKYLHVFICVCR